jgi:hypothetical protein
VRKGKKTKALFCDALWGDVWQSTRQKRQNIQQEERKLPQGEEQ